MPRATGRLLLIVGLLVGGSWLLLPALEILDVWIVTNPRPADPLHLLLVLFVVFLALWIILPVLSPLLLLALAAVAGGAVSNISYRLLWGPVPDYIPLPFGAYGNVADMMIMLGLPLYLFLVVRIAFYLPWRSSGGGKKLTSQLSSTWRR